MSTKEETRLGNRWIDNFRQQVSERNERVKIFKIHGGKYQETGISDWTGCFRGRYLAIEFKVGLNEPTKKQYEFLTDIIECDGAGLVITIVTAPKNYKSTSTIEELNRAGYYIEGQERQVVILALSGKPMMFSAIFIYQLLI